MHMRAGSVNIWWNAKHFDLDWLIRQHTAEEEKDPLNLKGGNNDIFD